MQRKMSKRLFSILCAVALVATLMSTLFISVSAAAGDINDVNSLGAPGSLEFGDYVKVADAAVACAPTTSVELTSVGYNDAPWADTIPTWGWKNLVFDLFVTDVDTLFGGGTDKNALRAKIFDWGDAAVGNTTHFIGADMVTGWNRITIPVTEFDSLNLTRMWRVLLVMETDGGATLGTTIRLGNVYYTDPEKTPLTNVDNAPAAPAGALVMRTPDTASVSGSLEPFSVVRTGTAFDVSAYSTLEFDIYVDDITKFIINRTTGTYTLPSAGNGSARIKIQTGTNYGTGSYNTDGDGDLYAVDYGTQIKRSGWNHIVIELPDQRNSAGTLWTAAQQQNFMDNDSASAFDYVNYTTEHNVTGAHMRSVGNLKLAFEWLPHSTTPDAGTNKSEANLRLGNVYFSNQRELKDVTFVDADGAALSGAASTEATNAVDVQLGHKADTYNVTVTNPVGKMLKGGMLYYSENVGGTWSNMRPLAGRVNSRFYDGVDSATQAANEDTSVSFYNITAAGNTTGEIKIFAEFVADTFTASITTDKTSDNALKVFGVSTRDGANAGLQFGTRAYRNITVGGVEYDLKTCGTVLVKASTVAAWTDAQSAKAWVDANATLGEFKKVPTTSLLDRCDDYVDFSVRIVNMTNDTLKNTEYVAVPYANYESADGTPLDIVAYTPSNPESYVTATAKKNF